jgi:hypothetical protein
MSQIKILLNVISDIKSLGESLEALAQALTANEIGKIEEYEEIYNSDKETTVTAPVVDRATVKSKLAELTRNGHTDDVKDLLRKHGAERFSAIQDEELPALMKEAEAIDT